MNSVSTHRQRVFSRSFDHKFCESRFRSFRKPPILRVLAQRKVDIEVGPAPGNGRFIFANTQIASPLDGVWKALTVYEELQTFIPGLSVNRCILRRDNGARLLQIGQQDVALGLKFRARCLLDVTEYPEGLCQDYCISNWDKISSNNYNNNNKTNGNNSRGGNSANNKPNNNSNKPLAAMKGLLRRKTFSASDFDNNGYCELFPLPRSPNMPCKDLTFELVEGDFQVFKGLWRVVEESPNITNLSYSLFVRPHIWLPVQLIENRIQREVVANLKAVAEYVENKQMRLKEVSRGNSFVDDRF